MVRLLTEPFTALGWVAWAKQRQPFLSPSNPGRPMAQISLTKKINLPIPIPDRYVQSWIEVLYESNSLELLFRGLLDLLLVENFSSKLILDVYLIVIIYWNNSS